MYWKVERITSVAQGGKGTSTHPHSAQHWLSDARIKLRMPGLPQATPQATLLLHLQSQSPQHTFRVSSMDRNFLWSPISMALLMIGSSVFTASSMGTGGTFSPPAVMINSVEASQV